jgi:hypothetical protein
VLFTECLEMNRTLAKQSVILRDTNGCDFEIVG